MEFWLMFADPFIGAIAAYRLAKRWRLGGRAVAAALLGLFFAVALNLVIIYGLNLQVALAYPFAEMVGYAIGLAILAFVAAPLAALAGWYVARRQVPTGAWAKIEPVLLLLAVTFVFLALFATLFGGKTVLDSLQFANFFIAWVVGYKLAEIWRLAPLAIAAAVVAIAGVLAFNVVAAYGLNAAAGDTSRFDVVLVIAMDLALFAYFAAPVAALFGWLKARRDAQRLATDGPIAGG